MDIELHNCSPYASGGWVRPSKGRRVGQNVQDKLGVLDFHFSEAKGADGRWGLVVQRSRGSGGAEEPGREGGGAGGGGGAHKVPFL